MARSARVLRDLASGGSGASLRSPRELVKQGTRSGGSPLPGPARAKMEARFGHDFGHVRVHDGPEAGLSADALEAHAYTIGSDIVFNQGQFNPNSADGDELLAHELTHVVQQDGTGGAADGELELSDPADPAEQEAEQIAGDLRTGGH